MTSTPKQPAALKQEMLINKLRDVLGRMEIATMMTSDPMVWTDSRGRVQWCNNTFEDLIGLTRMEMLGSLLVEVFPLWKNGEKVPKNEHPVSQILTQQTHKVEQYTFRSGEVAIELEISQAPTNVPDDTQSAVLVMRRLPSPGGQMMTDSETAAKIDQLQLENTDLKKQLEQLTGRLEAHENREADDFSSSYRAKNAFLANMNHELRTPLSAIMGYADLLYRDLLAHGYAEWANDASQIRQASDRLFFMITQLLDLAAIEEDLFDLKQARFSIPDLLREIEQVSREQMVEHKNTLQITVADGVDFMISDQEKLRKILLNLLNNATKFTLEGEINLDVRAEGSEQVVFTISDTGLGMTANQIARIFDPFTQGDESITRHFEGGGIGLHICEQFCRRMGGHIEVQSKPGEGSTFIVFLPREANGEKKSEQAEAA